MSKKVGRVDITGMQFVTAQIMNASGYTVGEALDADGSLRLLLTLQVVEDNTIHDVGFGIPLELVPGLITNLSLTLESLTSGEGA